MFMDTGLLAHWGLRLEAAEVRGAASRMLAGIEVATASPGSLTGDCRISKDRLVAECAIGRGRALVVADADLLNVDSDNGGKNLEALLAALASLEAN